MLLAHPIILSSVALLAGLAAAQSPSLPPPVAVSTQVNGGTYVGQTCKFNPRYANYLGIPFAKAPTGALRFAAPVAYDGPFKSNVTTMPPACLQNEFAGAAPPKIQSEDCLFLNVFAPATKPATPLPVRFFIYGGGFQSGDIASIPYYDGCFAGPPTNSIVVTANYRVGALGFLAHPAFAGSDGSVGNYGFLDQQLALKWVKANIAQFGGDPDHIGIWGESAGGASVFAHLAAPSSAGLFDSGVAESGDLAGMFPKDVAAEIASEYAKTAGCGTGDVVACLRAAPADALRNATMTAPKFGEPGYNLTTVLSYNNPTYGLVHDGVIFPKSLLDSFKSGSINKVPLLAGSNAREAALFFPNATFTADDYNKYINESFGAALAANITSLYPLSATQTPNRAIESIMTDRWFACPTRKALAGVSAAKLPAYSYFFNVTLTCDFVPGLSAAALGASHYAEIPFVFDFTQFSRGCALPQSQKDVALVMGQAWTSMAATGHPASNTSQPAWPVYPAYEELTDATGAVPVTGGNMIDYWNARCAVFDSVDASPVYPRTNFTAGADNAAAAPNGGTVNATGLPVNTPASAKSGAESMNRASSFVASAVALVALLFATV
ncbi:hypothetical protein HDU87_006509 [Geranomyces variabilis]|uniref:Carboxylic ester hydrolase n=1 Tax=Geranomyces variabilis TaxID=109894 RepID=A0AAD5XKA5_9FUNG|nr:hypothetical protein HDU87_006509 [Geranomyces variabilis]